MKITVLMVSDLAVCVKYNSVAGLYLIICARFFPILKMCYNFLFLKICF